jgi:hypothetical protein
MDSAFVDYVKKSVTFFFDQDTSNEEVVTPFGTGFFVGVNCEKDPTKGQGYLVSAKHVLQDSNGNFRKDVLIRLNLNGGGSQLLKIPLDRRRIFIHDDPIVDLVVYPMNPDMNLFDYSLILPQYFGTQELLKRDEISEGDDVFFAGLFESHFGFQQNHPILRFGKIALMSNEKIAFKERHSGSISLADLYLIECMSFAGNSGSPVFFYLSPTRRSNELVLGSPQMYLAGIIKGGFHHTDILATDTFLEQNVVSQQ